MMAYVVKAQSFHEKTAEQEVIQSWLHTSITESVYSFDITSTQTIADQSVLNDWLIQIDVFNDFDTLLASSLTQNKVTVSQKDDIKVQKIPLIKNNEKIGHIKLTTIPIKSTIDLDILIMPVVFIILMAFIFSFFVRWFIEKKITSSIDSLTQIIDSNNIDKLNELASRKGISKEISQLAIEFLLRNEQLTKQATEDTLTELPNRRAFTAIVNNVLSKKKGFILGLIDIDHFKQINDTFGHAAGDELLIQCAKAISNSIGKQGHVARLGGDEFAFLIECNDIAIGTEYAEKILKSVADVNQKLSEIEISISASIGLAGPLLDTTEQDALRFADIALYEAKNAGRACYYVYREGLDQTSQRWLEIKAALTYSIKNDDLNYELDHIIDLTTMKPHGNEMLLRLTDQNKEIHPPLKVIDIAIQTGQISALAFANFNSAIAILKENPDISRLFLNFNSTELLHLDTPFFHQRLQQNSYLAKRLVFEVTETRSLDDPALIMAIENLHQKGVRFALDDFGTGFSSLSSLSVLPLDYIKIDHSIVHAAFEGTRGLALLRTILALQQNFGVQIIAEGIESKAILRFLQKEGALLGQGYYFKDDVFDAGTQETLGVITPLR